MTNRLLTLAVIGAVGAGSAASVATAHNGRGKVGSARTQIATVTSYSSGTLTLKTTGGATVTASVTGRTRISCLALAAGTTPTPTPTATTAERLHRGEGGGRGRGGDDYGSDDVCDTTTLTAGTAVLGAATELTASGQRFTKVILATTAASSDDYTSY